MMRSELRHLDRRVATVLAVALLAPGALFFVAVVGRSLQPVAHEPSRTLNAIANGFLALPPAIGVALIMVAPLLAMAVAAVVVWRTVATDPALGQDLRRVVDAALPLVRRPTLLVAIATLVVAAGMAGVLAVHAIAG